MESYTARNFVAFFVALVVAVIAFAGESYAADGPAPAPASAAAGVSPSLFVAALVSLSAFFLGSFFR